MMARKLIESAVVDSDAPFLMGAHKSQVITLYLSKFERGKVLAGVEGLYTVFN